MRASIFILIRSLIICVQVVAVAGVASATVFQWDGGGANTNWGTTANWVTTAPANSDQTDLEFGTVALQSPSNITANNNISNDFNLNSMTFGSPAGASFTITGSTLDWKKDGTTNPSIIQNSSFNHAINVLTKISGDSLTFTGNGTGLITLGGNITTGGKALIKAGTSSYVLRATLSDNHTLSINDGTFALGVGANINASNIQFGGGVLATSGSFTRALGSSSGQVRWAAGGGGFAAYGGALTVDIGGSTSQTWASTTNFVPNGSPLIFGSVIADNVVTYVDGINLGGGTPATREIRVIDNPNSSADYALISGAITAGSGNKTLNKTGDGILELSNANSHATTTVSAGTLRVTNTSGSGTGGTVTISSGATLAIGNGGTGGIVTGTITDNGTLEFNRSNDYSHGENISGTGVVIKNGAGAVTLGGDNSYAGTTTINSGTLIVDDDTALGTAAGSTTVVSGATLGFQGSINYSNAESVGIAGVGVSGIGAIQNISGTNTFGGAITLAANSSIGSASGTLTLINVIAGGFDLTKVGAGTLALSGANTYGGSTTINAGTLQLGASNVIPNGSAISLANTSGANLDVNNQTETIASLSGGGAAGGNVQLGSGTLTTGNATNTTYAGVISGTGGSLVKQDSGSMTLAGANTYSGGTSVTGGTLLAENTSGSATGSGMVTVSSGATLGIGSGGANGAVSGNITNNGTVEFNRSDDTSHAGQISGSGVLTKSGAGKLTLSGNSSYSGNTNVNDGTLLVNGNNTGTGTVVVNEGATFGGTGGVAGAVTVNSGGTLSPGASIESLDTGALSFAAGSTFTYEIDSSQNLNVAADLVNAHGSLSIATSGAGVALAITDEPSSTPLPAGTKLTLISYDGPWDETSIFAGYANETQFTLGANTFLIRYDDSSPGGNFVARTGIGVSYVTLSISAVPEASVILFGSLLLCGAVAFQRARTRWQLKVVEVRHG